MTWLVVGLGNPGPEYAATRHNAGFMVVDLLAENLRASYWKDEGGARTAVVRVGDDDLVLAEPQTYVNLSGKAVAKLAAGYDLGPANVLVVHDDLDLPPADVRVKRGGGHGGHNGLRPAAAEEIAAAIPTAVEAVLCVVERGVDIAMREFNGP